MDTASFARNGVGTWGLVAVALGLVAVATLVPTAATMGGRGTPFWCLTCGDYALADALANVALFVPFGWAMARTGVRPSISLAVIPATTIGIEFLQHSFVPGRTASASDILTNTVGGVAGMALHWLQSTIGESGERGRRAATLYGVVLVMGLGAGAATQAVPRPRTLRWTQGGMASRDYVPFTGSVRTVRVDGRPIALDAWTEVPPAETTAIAVDLVSGRPDTGLAQVLIAWMPSGSGWVWLEQRHRDLHVHVASASDGSRLRGHSEWLSSIMPALAGEPVTVRLVVRRFWYRIAVMMPAGEVVREVSLSPEDGWRLFAPLEREWKERLTAALAVGWMAVLLAPLGYLASVRSRSATVVAAAGAGASLLLLPVLSGCAWLPASGWCGAAAGFLVGSRGRTRRASGGASD